MIAVVRGFGAAYLAVSAAATAISISDNLPANFANWHLTSGNITRDFLVGGGTALGAPLWALVPLAVLLVLCAQPTPTGRFALALLIVVAIVLVVGMLGEPVAREALKEPGAHIDRTVVVIAGLVLPLGIAAGAQTAYQLHRQGTPL